MFFAALNNQLLPDGQTFELPAYGHAWCTGVYRSIQVKVGDKSILWCATVRLKISPQSLQHSNSGDGGSFGAHHARTQPDRDISAV